VRLARAETTISSRVWQLVSIATQVATGEKSAQLIVRDAVSLVCGWGIVNPCRDAQNVGWPSGGGAEIWSILVPCGTDAASTRVVGQHLLRAICLQCGGKGLLHNGFFGEFEIA